MIVRFIKTVGFFSTPIKQLQMIPVTHLAKRFTTDEKRPVAGVRIDFKKIMSIFSELSPAMTIEEKSKVLRTAQKEGKLSADKILLVSEAERELKKRMPRIDKLSSESSWNEVYTIGKSSVDIIDKELGGRFAQDSHDLLYWVKEICSSDDITAAIKGIRSSEHCFRSLVGPLNKDIENWRDQLQIIGPRLNFEKPINPTVIAIDNLAIIANKLVTDVLNVRMENDTPTFRR